MTTINWASMENTGWEFALNTSNISTKDFTWTTSLNLGFNKNKILNETVAENSTYPGREGYPVGAIFAYRTAGVDADGYPLFRAKDGTAVPGRGPPGGGGSDPRVFSTSDDLVQEISAHLMV